MTTNILPQGQVLVDAHGCHALGYHILRDHDGSDAQWTGVAENTLPTSQGSDDTQTRSTGGTLSPETSVETMPIHHASRGTALPRPKSDAEPIAIPGGDSNLQGPKLSPDPMHRAAPASLPADQKVNDAHLGLVGGTLNDGLLGLLADSLDDLEHIRISTENRVRQLTRKEVDSDGETRGLGLDARSPDVARAMGILDQLRATEHDAELQLKRRLRLHPLYGWVKREKGVGEKQAARLIAAIGDPYWNDLEQRPRTVSELWAWCGYAVIKLPASQLNLDAQSALAGGSTLPGGHMHSDSHALRAPGIAQHRRKGQRANWSATAKMRAYLVATSCVKAKGRYRDVYDHGRTKYADAVHTTPCVRCGPAGHPAPVGSPLSAGHQHARALRLVSKEILKDLWTEAKHAHEEGNA